MDGKTAAEPQIPGRAGNVAIVGFDANDWIGPWMNRQHILSRLANRGWPVYYSTGALYKWELAAQKDRLRLFGSVEFADGVRLAHAGRLYFRWPRFGAWDRWTVSRHGAFIRQTVLAAERRTIVAHVFNPEYLCYVDALQPDYFVFHLRDDYRQFGHWDESRQQELDQCAERCDLLVVASQEMCDQLPGHLRNKALVLPNGADTKAFSSGVHQEVPVDLRDIPRPRVGYVGALSLKFDWDMLLRLAEREPDWHWVLVGPIRFASRPDVEDQAKRSLALPNVHWLGEKPHLDLPAYVAHCDVNTLLYRTSGPLGAWTYAASPLKLHEYLASGRPVVGAAIPSISRFRNVVDVVSNSEGMDGWQRALRNAIEDGGISDSASRIAVAEQNSWDKRLDLLETWYSKMLLNTKN